MSSGRDVRDIWEKFPPEIFKIYILTQLWFVFWYKYKYFDLHFDPAMPE